MKISSLWPLPSYPLTMRNVLFVGYSLFLAGFFVFPQAGEHYKFYYIAVLLPSLFVFSHSVAGVKGNRLFTLMLAYVLFMALSATWSHSFSALEFGRVITRAFQVVAFFLVTSFLRQEFPERFDQLLRWLIITAALAGLISALVWYSEHVFPESRLEPISRMDNPNLAGCAYGLFAVLAARYLLNANRQSIRLAYGLLLLVLLGTVLLTQSRTAIGASAIALLVLFATRRSLSLLAVLTLVIGLTLATAPEITGRLDLALPFRGQIWSAVMEKFMEAPILGHGYLYSTEVAVAGIIQPHAHSAYLATLRDGGIIGLLLLLAVLGYACGRAIRIGLRTKDFADLTLLVYAVICIAPDVDRLVTRPKEYWLYFWLPIALLMTHRPKRGAAE